MLCTHAICADIQIGFTHGSYSFLEPSRSPRLITSVELVRDGGRQSEQTFEVQVSVWGGGGGGGGGAVEFHQFNSVMANIVCTLWEFCIPG